MIAGKTEVSRRPLPWLFFAAAILCTGVPSRLVAAPGGDSAGSGSISRPALRLAGAPAGDLVEVPSTSEKAEVVRFESNLAAGLLTVAMEETVVVSDWPVAPGERAEVVLTRRDVYAPEAEIWEIGKRGRQRVPRSTLVFLWGQAEGDPDLRVLVSVDPASRELRGFAVTPTGTHELQPLPKSWRAGAGYLVGPRDFLLDDRGQVAAKDWSCGEEEQPGPLPWLAEGGGPVREKAATALWGAAGIATLQTATVAVDTDNQIMANKFGGNVGTAANYIASLFAQMNLIYERDLLVRLLQGTTFLRTSPDSYIVNDTPPYSDDSNLRFSMLQEFASNWSANQVGVNRALALMLSGRGGAGFAGTAWINVLCSKSNGYALSRVYTNGTTPNFGDVQATAHELGHNFGSPHTHCYNIQGLPNPDNCYNGQSGSGCFSGTPVCPNLPVGATYNGVTGVLGTLMSYCHLLSGCSVSLVFHPWSVDLLDDIILSHASGANACIFPFVPAAPTVSSVTPNTGRTVGGTAITVTGTNFVNGATVTFGAGGSAVAGTSVVVVNATTITVVAPAHATGAARVTVTNPTPASGFKDGAYFYAPPPAAAGFYTLTPCRVLDTRNAVGPLGGPSLAANSARLFTVTGVCGIPVGAKAISVNVTVVAGAGSGSFSFYPGNAFALGTNNLNFPSGANRAGASILSLATDGTGTIGVQSFSAVGNHLILDVNGYFQ